MDIEESMHWNQARGRGRPLKPFFERVKNSRKSNESWKAAMKRVKKLNDKRRSKSLERKNSRKSVRGRKTLCSKHNPPCPLHCKNSKGKCVEKKKAASKSKSSKQRQSTDRRHGPKFVSSPTFRGSKKGYVFKTGKSGTGYYKDRPKHDSKKSISSRSRHTKSKICSAHKPPCPKNCVTQRGKCMSVEQWLNSK